MPGSNPGCSPSERAAITSRGRSGSRFLRAFACPRRSGRRARAPATAPAGTRPASRCRYSLRGGLGVGRLPDVLAPPSSGRRVDVLAIGERIGRRRAADVVAQASCGPVFVIACGSPISTRIPRSGSSVSSSDPMRTVPRPSNTTMTCSEPLVAVPARAAAGLELHLAQGEGVGPEVPRLDEHAGAGRPAPPRRGRPPRRRTGSPSAIQVFRTSPGRSGSTSTAARRASASIDDSLRTRWYSAGAS